LGHGERQPLQGPTSEQPNREFVCFGCGMASLLDSPQRTRRCATHRIKFELRSLPEFKEQMNGGALSVLEPIWRRLRRSSRRSCGEDNLFIGQQYRHSLDDVQGRRFTVSGSRQPLHRVRLLEKGTTLSRDPLEANVQCFRANARAGA
jgi:hypothetical protein